MTIFDGFSGAALVAGVCGWPIKHSRSPRIHNYWLRQYGIDGVYVPFAMPPEGAKDAIRKLPELGIRGINVTAPNKEQAYKAMDNVDRWARRLKAVNTIVVRGGVLHGANTDAFGFLESLRNAKPDWRADAGPVVVLGAGGAARAIVAGLQDKGAPEIRIANRTPGRAEAIRDEFGGSVRAIPWEQRGHALIDVALLVNATSLGMQGQPELDIDLTKLPDTAAVYDIVYVPLETPLLAAARARGNPAIDGLGMLLHQARPGFREWFGTDPVVDQALRDHVLAVL
ncbi:MAG: shikimate dehydrogenase [Rhodospirillaceae bacterium]|nr:shikimate dehydrogenase [Rhodospirillaceae bacterium]|tara:strand:- start:461 stop:1312 length:852 start_codon:yes stop_codon:yes gene_type:complete